MTERQTDSDNARFDSSTREEEIFDPETASIDDLSHHMILLAGQRDPTDVTDDRIRAYWRTDIDDIFCTLSAFDTDSEPVYLLEVQSAKRIINYQYGAYLRDILYSDTGVAESAYPDQDELENRLSRLLRYGYKKLLENEMRGRVERIYARVAIEELIKEQHDVRKMLGHVANSNQPPHASIVSTIARTYSNQQDEFIVPDIFFKAELIAYCEELQQNPQNPILSRWPRLRRARNYLNQRRMGT